ncbi:MAG TPA: tetratricopeptide repeat protein [Bryobacteraceae bacterium]|nr:tetratricopeptide repeat protein [Bryobacteraceae bacterium]
MLWLARKKTARTGMAAEEPVPAAPRRRARMERLWFAFTTALIVHAQITPATELAVYQKLDQAQRLNPRDAASLKAWLDEAARLATLAAEHIERRRYAQAATLLRATERPLSEAPSWNNLRGYAEFKLGNAKAALHYLQRAVHLDPRNEDYLIDIGEFLGSYRAHQEAVRFFEVAAKRMPQSPRVTFGLAVAYILQNRRDEAQSLLEQLIAAQPRFEVAYKALGECYEDAGNFKGMMELGKSLQSINPQNALGWYLEGAGLLREGRIESTSLDASIKILRKALRLQPSNTRAHFLLARALQESGANQEAVAELEQTLRMDPDHERAHYVLARLHQKAGNAAAAKREFDRHAQIKKRDSNAQYRRLLISIRE